jgi:hypothetical protein
MAASSGKRDPEEILFGKTMKSAPSQASTVKKAK